MMLDDPKNYARLLWDMRSRHYLTIRENGEFLKDIANDFAEHWPQWTKAVCEALDAIVAKLETEAGEGAN